MLDRRLVAVLASLGVVLLAPQLPTTLDDANAPESQREPLGVIYTEGDLRVELASVDAPCAGIVAVEYVAAGTPGKSWCYEPGWFNQFIAPEKGAADAPSIDAPIRARALRRARP
jgi:hypothetical protein